MAEIPKPKGSVRPPEARGSIMAPRSSIPPARVSIPPVRGSIPPVRGSIPPPAIKYTSRLPLRGRTPKLGRTAGKFTQFRRLDRLRETLESHPGGLSLEDLATMLRVTTRSVRRYLKELEHERQIESVPTAPGGAHLWRIKPSERGRALLLRRTQAYGLLATRRVFEMIRGSALFDEVDLVHRQLVLLAQRPAARAGVRGEIPSDQRLEERVVYVPHPPRNYAAKAEELDALFDAVANLRVIRVRYDGGTQPLTLHPYALFLHKGAIFCAGHEVDTKTTCVLSFDRMRGTSIVDGKGFTLPDGLDLNEFIQGEFGIGWAAKRIKVLIEFEARAAEEVRARKVHPTQRLATASDGRMRLSMSVTDLAEVQGWVLAFGDAARVIEPRELVESVSAALRAALAKYDAV